MVHNYVAEAAERPEIKLPKDRFKKGAEEKAKLFGLKIAYEIAMKKEYGSKWKSILRKMAVPVKEFKHKTYSGPNVIAAWN